ncbi:MAG: PD-(D/E)XK nuclease family protein, partial [Spongiibacteraceae bacterium]
MSQHFPLSALLALPGRSVVLMPSEASAKQLRDDIARLRGGHDQAFIEQLTVVPVDQWLVALWDASFPAKQVLRPIQLQALARSVIENSDCFPDDCLNIMEISRQFVDAFQLLADYQLSDAAEHYLFSREYQAFYQWRQALQVLLDEQAALSSAQLPEHLQALLLQNALDLPDQLLLHPLLTLTPAIEGFVDACGESLSCQPLELVENESTLSLSAETQIQDECDRVAAAVADTLTAHEGDDMLGYALLVPDMRRYQQPLQASLCRYFYPASLFPREADGLREPWQFEGVEKLLSYPLISAAWDIISLQTRGLPLDQLSRVLRSRFVQGWPEQRSERAALDLQWRERLTSESTLRSALVQSEPGTVVFLAELQQLLETAPAEQLPSSWVRFFDQCLLASGWPNADDDDHVVQQCRRGFSQAMDVFRALDRQLGEISHSAALGWLQNILSSKRFSVARDWPCPIRIMTYDDAVGLNFDALWILGLDDGALPRAAAPQPFLPSALQRSAGIVQSDPARCLLRDRQLLASLLTASPVVQLSYSRENASGSPVGPCNLLPVLDLVLSDEPSSRYAVSGSLRLPDSDAIGAVSPAQRKAIRGGTGLFKEYAQSPFFAFLKYRLYLQPFPLPVEGLDHRLQGILLHDALQFFWEQIKSKSALEALAENKLISTVSDCAERAMAAPQLALSRFSSGLLAIEKARIVELVVCWLKTKEAERLEDFEVVACEQTRREEFMGIPLTLRIDRIDNVSGKILLIDYKTGAIDGKSLNANQLTEPQLPIYALIE